jgi:hypothetical protein
LSRVSLTLNPGYALVGRMAATPKEVIARYNTLGAEKGK